jgi:hypothetical protein
MFLLAEWLILTGQDSFSGVLGILGVLTNSIFSGLIPVLLLVASRRKGEVVPGVVLSFLGNPLILGGIYLLYTAVLLAHGLIIWEAPAARAAALLTAVLALGATAAMVRGGAFNRRVVVELREDLRQAGRSAFAVTSVGRPAQVDVRLEYAADEQRCRAATGEIPEFGALRRATFQLPAGPARELKVWAHRATPEGASEGLPALLEVQGDGETRQVDLKLSAGQALLPIRGAACRVTIALAEPAAS